jgi:hypothetical protein
MRLKAFDPNALKFLRCRGRKKHVWVSTSEDLSLDAERDLRDVNCHINVIKNLQMLDKEQKATGLSKGYQEGNSILQGHARLVFRAIHIL